MIRKHVLIPGLLGALHRRRSTGFVTVRAVRFPGALLFSRTEVMDQTTNEARPMASQARCFSQ